MRLYRFPRDKHRRKLWTDRVRRKGFVPSEYSSLCQNHFTDDQFVTFPCGTRRLRPDALPSIFIHRTFGNKNIMRPTKRVKVTPLVDHPYALPPTSSPSLVKGKGAEVIALEKENVTNNVLLINLDEELRSGITGPTVHVEEISQKDHQFHLELYKWKSRCYSLERKCKRQEEEIEKLRAEVKGSVKAFDCL